MASIRHCPRDGRSLTEGARTLRVDLSLRPRLGHQRIRGCWWPSRRLAARALGNDASPRSELPHTRKHLPGRRSVQRASACYFSRETVGNGMPTRVFKQLSTPRRWVRCGLESELDRPSWIGG
ncbi:Hypothetical protein GQ85_010 [Rhodococcus rhodochrous]|nr:hypothetical protein [Rhodococcus rhodochrous]OOL33114.1 Hypothetical protein GQ85_010 [Rhodococcus rhodochrous]